MLEIGRITRAQGLRGEVIVHLITSEQSRVAPGSELLAGDRTLVVVASRPHQRNHAVQFDGVTTREAAEALRGLTLYAEPNVDDDGGDDLWVHELIGAEVIDQNGTSRGVVESVQENPASDLLVLESGALVPLTFVGGWIERGAQLRIDAPEGLFDL